VAVEITHRADARDVDRVQRSAAILRSVMACEVRAVVVATRLDEPVRDHAAQNGVQCVVLGPR